MANLLDQDDNFPENPFENPGNDDSVPAEFGSGSTSQMFGEAPSSPTTVIPEASSPLVNPASPSLLQAPTSNTPTSTSSLGDILGTNNTSDNKPNINSILSGDSLFSVPKASENDDKLR